MSHGTRNVLVPYGRRGGVNADEPAPTAYQPRHGGVQRINYMSDAKRSFWISPNGLAAITSIGAISYFVSTEPWARPDASFVVLVLIAMGLKGFSGIQL